MAIYFLASPWALALVVAREAGRRTAMAGTDPRDASRRFSRWFGLPWLLYLLNVLAGGTYVASDTTAPLPGDLEQVVWSAGLVFVAAVPAFLIARVTRSWESSLGHPGGRVTVGVEARAWLAWAGFLVTGLGTALTGMTLGGGLVGIVVAAVAVATYLTVYPDLFRWIWKAYPLADDDQGRRIRGLLSRHGAPVHRVFVIPSIHGAAANAFVSGPVKRKRYLFLTEQLLRHFSPEEVDAVVAHEIGHVYHRHVARLGGALIGTAVLVATSLLGVVGLAFSGASAQLRTPLFGAIGFLTVLASLVVTRRMGRRYEFEADDFSARTLGSGEPMARALRKLAQDNWLVESGMDAGSLASHPTVERRIQRLADE